LEKGSRDADALLLAAGEVWPPLADRRLVALGERADELVGIRRLCGRDDLLLGRIQPPVADVRLDRPGEQERLLEHERDLLPERREGELADVDPVEEDPALLRIV